MANGACVRRRRRRRRRRASARRWLSAKRASRPIASSRIELHEGGARADNCRRDELHRARGRQPQARRLSVTEKRLEEERRAATERQPYQRRPKTLAFVGRSSARRSRPTPPAAAARRVLERTVAPALTETPASEKTALTKSLFKLVWEHAGEVEGVAVASRSASRFRSLNRSRACACVCKGRKGCQGREAVRIAGGADPLQRPLAAQIGRQTGRRVRPGRRGAVLGQDVQRVLSDQEDAEGQRQVRPEVQGRNLGRGSVTDYSPTRLQGDAPRLARPGHRHDQGKGRRQAIAERMPYFAARREGAAGALHRHDGWTSRHAGA